MTCLDVFLWIWYFTYVNQWYRAEPCRWNVNSLPRLNPPWEPNGIAIVLLLWNFIVVISFHNTWCIFQHLPCAYFRIYIRLCIFQHSIQKKTTNICLALCTGTPTWPFYACVALGNHTLWQWSLLIIDVQIGTGVLQDYPWWARIFLNLGYEKLMAQASSYRTWFVKSSNFWYSFSIAQEFLLSPARIGPQSTGSDPPQSSTSEEKTMIHLWEPYLAMNAQLWELDTTQTNEEGGRIIASHCISWLRRELVPGLCLQLQQCLRDLQNLTGALPQERIGSRSNSESLRLTTCLFFRGLCLTCRSSYLHLRHTSVPYGSHMLSNRLAAVFRLSSNISWIPELNFV